MKPSELIRLSQLAQQRKTRDVAAYANAVDYLAKIDREIENLQTEARGMDLSAQADVQSVALWKRWAEQEEAKLRSLQQSVKPEAENLRQRAIKSFARLEALKRLQKDAEQQLVVQNRKRAEQIGLPPDA